MDCLRLEVEVDANFPPLRATHFQSLLANKKEGYASITTFFHPEATTRFLRPLASAALARHIMARMWEADWWRRHIGKRGDGDDTCLAGVE